MLTDMLDSITSLGQNSVKSWRSISTYFIEEVFTLSKSKVSFGLAIFNVMNAIIGSGILGLAYAGDSNYLGESQF